MVVNNNGFSWGIFSDEIQSQITLLLSLYSLPYNVLVTRTGFGGESQFYSYIYTIIFKNLVESGYPLQLDVLTNSQTTRPYYVSNNDTAPETTLNDLSIIGVYNGTDDITFVVSITKILRKSNYSNVDMFTWIVYYVSSTDTIYEEFNPINITANKIYYLYGNISISFTHSYGHNLNDFWTFTSVKLSKNLPTGSTITKTVDNFISKTTNQIIVDKGYEGTSQSDVIIYKVPPIYTIQDQSNAVYEIITKYTTENVEYRISINFNYTLENNSTTTCVAWNAQDYQIESALSVLSTGLCKNATNCITVTRSVDSINNPGGYIYKIYFENTKYSSEAYSNILLINNTGCNVVDDNIASISLISEVVDHNMFSKYQIPLAQAGNSAIQDYYKGLTVERLPIYKVNGNYWIITFLTNLGDVPSLSISETKYLSEGTSMLAYDNIVRGVNPLSYTISDLNTGLTYYSRVKSYTSGYLHGYSNYSNSDSAIPYGPPPKISYLTAAPVYTVQEIQEISIVASHINEIQVISTTAASYAEVQEISLYSEDYVVIDRGSFSLRFPDVQILQFRGISSSDFNGGFKITYSYYDLSQSPAIITETNPSCLSFDSSEDIIESILESFHGIDDVSVVRSGYGGYSDYFGYSYSISFDGNNVTGVNSLLSITYGNDDDCSNSLPITLEILIDHYNDTFIVGLDTPVVTLNISADYAFAQGTYKIYYGSEETSTCVSWDASALEMRSALLTIPSIFSVIVERFGTGDVYSNFGYYYKVYFNNNYDFRNNISTLINVKTVDSSCEAMGYVSDGVFVAYDNYETIIDIKLEKSNKYSLPALYTTSTYLENQLGQLPTFVQVNYTLRSLEDDFKGYLWTILYDISAGNVPMIVCNTDNYLQSLGVLCSTSTVINGNYLGGYFVIDTSTILPFDVTADDMAIALSSLTTIGTVVVNRDGPNDQGGFDWTVTWISYSGDQPLLSYTNLLTGSGATITISTLQDGNSIDGSYRLEYNGYVSSLIAFNASASTLASALTSTLSSLGGSVTVTKSSSNTEGGSNYLVTFNGLYGDLDLLTAYYNSTLTGTNALVSIREVTKGSIASGSKLQFSFSSPLYCSYSQVLIGSCGSPVDYYYIDVGSSKSSYSSSVTVTADYSTQILRIAATSLYDSLYYIGEDATGYFKLIYNGESTGPISSHASALDIRDSLESLESINVVSVTRSYSKEQINGTVVAVPGSYTLTCVDSCDFNLIPPGDLIQIGGIWYRISELYDRNSYSLPLATENDSSVITYYSGNEDDSANIYRWARGYEWTITIRSVRTESDTILPLQSSLSGLNPIDATLAIRPNDCVNCQSIDGLSVWTEYFVRGRAHNSYGYGSYSLTTGTPKEIPSSPNSVSLTVLSSTQLEVTFSKPSGVNYGISQYVIQWDSSESFTQVLSNSPTCDTSGYGQCIITGASIAGTGPYHYVINYLSEGILYYVRVAARNAVSTSTSVSSTSGINSNVVFSEIVSATTSNQPPSAPVSVFVLTSGLTCIQVLITGPVSDGGLTITNYLIEYNSLSTFNDSSTYGYQTIYLTNTSIGLVSNSSSNEYFHEVCGLSTGQSYYVRVSAGNSKGYGSTTLSGSTVTPASKANPPTNVILSTPTSQTTAITTTNLSWSLPTSIGGSAIKGYLVEWWEDAVIHDQQIIQYTSKSFPSYPVGKFSLSFGPNIYYKNSTNQLSYKTNAYNVRSELMNLGYTSYTNESDYLIGNVRVTKSTISGKGYSWTVTFVDSKNKGNQVLLQYSLSSAAIAEGESISVSKVVAGQRNGGFHEIQILFILALSTNDSSALQGTFQLSFNGSEALTPYLSPSATAEQVQKAINQLDSVRPVTVTRNKVFSTDPTNQYAGYQWTITFSSNFGDMPTLGIYDALLTSSSSGKLVMLEDGDNSVDTLTGLKQYNTYPGELPVDYNYVILDSDVYSYQIKNLVPGNTYYAQVSTINSYGIGIAKPSSPSFTTPPLQIPQPPSDVSVSVHSGSSNTLDVTYSAPTSDGGSPVLYYRVELDTSIYFTNPIYNIIYCPIASPHSIFKVTSSGYKNDPIVGGSFTLSVSRNGSSFTSAEIPYNAPALMSDEIDYIKKISNIYVTLKPNETFVIASSTANELVFIGDRVQFVDHQSNVAEVYNVVGVNGTNITLASPLFLNTNEEVSSYIFRYYGGRGTVTTSNITCVYDSSLCPTDRLPLSGSMQGKLNSIKEALILGVDVDRDDPDNYNGITWRVTFLDDSPADVTKNYNLEIASNNIVTLNGSQASLTITQLYSGEEFTNCTGTYELPSGQVLVNGLGYYARVFAVNEIGYSLPQTSLTNQKPMVVPGAPTSVTLSVASSNSLKVVFYAPTDNGGDAITSYKIDYSTGYSFTDYSSVYLTSLSSGPPYLKTITGLTKGIYYFVRVSAGNSQGYGPSTRSTPASLNPYTTPSAPTDVYLYITSDTMLTVSFSSPADNGGDDVTYYRVEWDVSSSFNGLASSPNKGYIDLPASTYSSYTIQYLTLNQVYYVRVSAKNSGGFGSITYSYPTSAAPSLQIPGKPHTVIATTGTTSGVINVDWQYPRIPWFNVPCSGTPANPFDCPIKTGGTLPASTGGSAITEYEISYNELEDFSGFDSGRYVTKNNYYVIQNLTPGRRYYVRVLARNAQGSGFYCAYKEENCLIVSTHTSAIAKAA